MLFDGYQAADVIKPLHSSLAAANLSFVGIACCEGQGWSMQRQLTAEVQDAGAEAYLSLVTTHAYKGDPAEPDSPLNTSLKVWITENSPIMKRLGMTGRWHANGSENEGLTYANNLQTAFTTGNVSAYIYWIGAGSSRGEAPLVWIPNRNESTPAEAPWFQIASNYYVFVHWSRFIRPGAVRLGMGGINGTVLRASAYLNRDGSIVVQTVNNGDEAVPLDLGVPQTNYKQDVWITAWLTDNTHNMTQVDLEDTEGVNRYKMPARSLVTFVAKFR